MSNAFCGRFGVCRWVAVLVLLGCPISKNLWGNSTADTETVIIPTAALIEDWRVRAMQGDSEVQYLLGALYLTGDGVEQDFLEAHKWFEMAALREHIEAQYANAVLHQIQESYALAAFWYKLAAAKGHIDAQNGLALLYETGKGVAKDSKRAFEWYTRTAERGSAYAQNKLGQFYMLGDIVPKDERRARRFFRKAARQNFTEAIFHLGLMHLNGQGGLSSNRSRAVYLLQKAARAGYDKAKQKLLHLASTSSWQASARQGDAESQYLRGALYALGLMVRRDHAQALYWFDLAAQQGHVEAQYAVGALYFAKALDTPNLRHYEKAIFWFNKAAQADHAEAQYMLGQMYEEGKGIDQNWDMALYWYSKAALQGNADAQDRLGEHTRAEVPSVAADSKKTTAAQTMPPLADQGLTSAASHDTDFSWVHPLSSAMMKGQEARSPSNRIALDDNLSGSFRGYPVHPDEHRKPSTKDLLKALAQQLN